MTAEQLSAERLEELLADESGRKVLKHIAPSLALRVIDLENRLRKVGIIEGTLDATETVHSDTQSNVTAYSENDQ